MRGQWHTIGCEKIKKLVGDRPIAILKPLKQLIKNWFDSRKASFHREASRLDVGFGFRNKRVS